MDYSPILQAMSSCQKILLTTLALYVGLAVTALSTSPVFFFWDEWSWLKSLTENSAIAWTLQKHLGHLYPLGKLAYFLEITLFRDHYRAYLLVNVAVHVFNSVVLFDLARRLSGSEFVPLLVSSLYLFSPVQIENVFWGMQVAVLLAATCLLLSFEFVTALAEHGRRRYLAGAVAASCAAPFMFDLLLPAPLMALVLYSGMTGGLIRLLSSKDRRRRRFTVTLALAQLAVVAIYLAAGMLSSDHGNHPGATDHVLISDSLAGLSANHVRYVLFGIGSLPLHFLGVLSDSPPAELMMAMGLLLVLYAISRSGDRSSWAGCSRVYAAMVGPLLFLLSLKRMYNFNTSLTGRYLTLLYIPCALLWAQWLAARLESSEAIFAWGGRRWLRVESLRWFLALFTVVVIASHLVALDLFFRGGYRRLALSNALPRQRAAASAIPKFYALTDDARTSRRLLDGLSSPELTEAEALQIRRVLFGR